MPPKKETDPCKGMPHCDGSPRFSRVMELTPQEKMEFSDKTRCVDCGKERLVKRMPDPDPDPESEEEEKPAGMTIADTNR